MFVSFRKCSPPQKPDPISDRNCQNLYPISDQNGSKTIPFGAAHTYIPYIGEYPPPGLKYQASSPWEIISLILMSRRNLVLINARDKRVKFTIKANSFCTQFSSSPLSIVSLTYTIHYLHFEDARWTKHLQWLLYLTS